MEDSQFTAAFSRELSNKIGAQRFALWFSPPTHISAGANGLTIRAANTFVRDWLRQNFGDDVRLCWETVAGGPRPVAFEMDASIAHRASTALACADTLPGAEKQVKRRTSDRHEKMTRSSNQGQPAQVPGGQGSRQANGLRGAASLSSFVVGPSNEYAFRAAELTARGRQQASPLLFCGATGVGKTHLLRAIAREFRLHKPRAVAVYLSAEQFTTGFIEAIRGSGLPSFRQKCRGAHLLIIDDIQFFVGKQRTLEELQHTVDTLLADGRQLVFGSDRPLRDLQALGCEVMSRLSGGLICEIEPPEFATRLGIVRNISGELGLELSDDVVSAIATQITAGARELRGALHRIEATSHAWDQPITRELADKALADLARYNTRAVRLADVEQAVCGVFGVEPAQLRSERKVRSVSDPRMLAMWLARKYTRAAWSEIGLFFGRRSHSTVIAAHRRVERMISSQAQIGLDDCSCNVEEAIRRLEQALRTA